MFRNLFLLLIIMLSSALVMSAMSKDEGFNYEIEGAGTGTQGTYLVKITVITKDKKIADEKIASCAVHGVLFRGFSNKELRQSQRPLAGSAMAESQHADFFS